MSVANFMSIRLIKNQLSTFSFTYKHLLACGYFITAEMKLKASMMRKESRCSHYGLDYPDIDYKNWQAWINIDQDEQGEMRLEKQPFDK